MDEKELLSRARNLLQLEAKAVNACADRIGASFTKALELIEKAQDSGHKLVITGVGKSHYVAAKLSASFMSTGVTAIFMHPVEAFHGDLGVLRKGDVVLLLSKSGNTPELLNLIPFLKNHGCALIALTGNVESVIAKQSDVVLDASIEKEACPINLLPTASTTVALALGDALVAVLAEKRGFTRETFAGFHPGGTIGKRLNGRVRDVCNPLDDVAHGSAKLDLRGVAQALTEKPLGAFCAVDGAGKLVGLITEGDLRRAMARGDQPTLPAEKILNTKPTTLTMDLVIEDAIALLEQPGRRLNCAPVLSKEGVLLGLVHIHDLI